MCFSATASFSAATVIGSIGVATYKKCKHREMKFLASIPFLFAMQQVAEGFVWLSFTQSKFQGLQPSATIAFLFFAWVLWPILIPFSVYQSEAKGKKRDIIFYLFLLGCLTGAHSLYNLYAGNPQPLINDFHIDYILNYTSFELKFQSIQQMAYVFVTVIPLFLSSLKGAKVLATGNFFALVLAYVFFKHSLPSTWCFFAAILSGIIWWMVNKKYKTAGV